MKVVTWNRCRCLCKSISQLNLLTERPFERSVSNDVRFVTLCCWCPCAVWMWLATANVSLCSFTALLRSPGANGEPSFHEPPFLYCFAQTHTHIPGATHNLEVGIWSEGYLGTKDACCWCAVVRSKVTGLVRCGHIGKIITCVRQLRVRLEWLSVADWPHAWGYRQSLRWWTNGVEFSELGGRRLGN